MFFALCGFGGVLSCGLTHTAVVPLDLVSFTLPRDFLNLPLRRGHYAAIYIRGPHPEESLGTLVLE